MHAFTVHPQKKPPEPEAPPRRRWRRWVMVLLFLLGLGGLVWAVRPNPHLSRAQALQKELFGPGAKNLSPDDRKARFAEYRAEVKLLNADQKWALSAPMREAQKAEMDRYFAMSPKEKTKFLDERIDRAEKMRKEREQKQKAGQAQGKGGPPGVVGFGGPGGPGGNKAGGPGGPPGGPGGRPPLSPEEIEKRRKQFLERTTPEERAQMDVFRKEMNDRRKQRGLPVRA